MMFIMTELLIFSSIIIITDCPDCFRCMDGFYGNPVLGSGEHCRPCPCPGNPGSDHSNGDSCYADHASNQIICNCKQGYTGECLQKCLVVLQFICQLI